MTEGSHNIIKTRTIHKKEPYPFGLEHGLMTDLGIISCNKGDQMEDSYQNISGVASPKEI